MQPTQDLQTATTHMRAGRLDEAETVCRAVVNGQPDLTDALHLLALIKRQQGDFDEAESLFQTCLEKAPHRADIHANHGNLLKAQGRIGEAIVEYRRALEVDADFRPARIALARSLNAAGEYTDALAESQRLLRHDKADAEAWSAYGAALRGIDDLEASEIAYRRAINIKPGYGAAHHDLGALLAKESRHEQALEHLTLAAEAGVTGPEIVHNLASSLAGLGRFEETQALLLDATQALPHAIELHRLLARLRYMRGDPDFDGTIKTATTLLPDYLQLRVAHSQLLLAAGELDKAYKVLEDLNDTDVQDKAVQGELAAIHQEAGRYDDALRCAQAVAAGSESFGEHVDLIIDALMSLGRADEAMPYIEIARDEAPLNQWYVAMEATAARLLGDPRYEELYDYERFVQSYSIETPAGWSSIEEFRRDLNAALIERHKFRAQPLDQSLRNGTQTPRGLLGDPDPIIFAFLESLRSPIEEYRRHIGDRSTHPMTVRNRGTVKMTGCWSVRLSKDGYHVNHVHPEGWISSAYYAEVPPEVSDAERKSGWIKFGEPRFPVPGATAGKFVQPQAGSLVLFPSYMWHGTTPIIGDEPRMTVAFDAVCVDS